MRVGIVLHGPEIVDVGSAKKIIELFKEGHDVEVKLGGTMGRTAVLDAGLEKVIDISMGLTPSETINALKGCIDLAILLNHGKTLETGRHFGRLVASKLDPSVPFVHIERPNIDGRIIYYDSGAGRCAEYVGKILRKMNYDLPIESDRPVPLQVRLEDDKVVRRLAGTFPGENIRLDGAVIGYATQHEPEIVCRDGKVVELRGGRIKQHGLEKLENRSIDMFKAKVKTGSIRRTRHRPRIKRPQVSNNIVAIIDHCAESTFELVKDAGAVITVGDDTTAIAADILARLGIPIIGITDGDIDSILEDATVPGGSVIIRVREGYDDIVGRAVFREIMAEKQKIRLEIKDLTAKILAIAEKCLVNVKYY